jgi:hypothetical protein
LLSDADHHTGSGTKNRTISPARNPTAQAASIAAARTATIFAQGILRTDGGGSISSPITAARPWRDDSVQAGVAGSQSHVPVVVDQDPREHVVGRRLLAEDLDCLSAAW